jgi:hypothetical protein
MSGPSAITLTVTAPGGGVTALSYPSGGISVDAGGGAAPRQHGPYLVGATVNLRLAVTDGGGATTHFVARFAIALAGRHSLRWAGTGDAPGVGVDFFDATAG